MAHVFSRRFLNIVARSLNDKIITILKMACLEVFNLIKVLKFRKFESLHTYLIAQTLILTSKKIDGH